MRLPVAVAAVMFASVAFAQASSTGFDGKWVGDWNHGPTPAETDHLILSLTADQNNHVNGVVNVDKAFDVPLDWGFVANDEIVFQIQFPTEHGPFPLVFIGRMSGSAIDFGVAAHDLPAIPGLPADATNHMMSVFNFEAAKQP